MRGATCQKIPHQLGRGVVVFTSQSKGWNGSNPFAAEQVKEFIRRDLDPLFQGQYEIQLVPNIVNITYGRDVGYKIEQETFDDATHSISATKIREAMGFKTLVVTEPKK